MNPVRREKRRRLTAWLAAAAVLVSLHVIRPADVSAAAKKSVVSRDDGVWLFPLDAAFMMKYPIGPAARTMKTAFVFCAAGSTIRTGIHIMPAI